MGLDVPEPPLVARGFARSSARWTSAPFRRGCAVAVSSAPSSIFRRPRGLVIALGGVSLDARMRRILHIRLHGRKTLSASQAGRESS